MSVRFFCTLQIHEIGFVVQVFFEDTTPAYGIKVLVFLGLCAFLIEQIYNLVGT